VVPEAHRSPRDPLIPQAFVLGRVGADLYPLQIETPLEEVRTFERFVGGFAGNVATGLARLACVWRSYRRWATMATAGLSGGSWPARA